MGGGRAKFLPQSSGGERLDGKDLVAAWLQDKTRLGKSHYVTSRQELMKTNYLEADYLLGGVICWNLGGVEEILYSVVFVKSNFNLRYPFFIDRLLSI